MVDRMGVFVVNSKSTSMNLMQATIIEPFEKILPPRRVTNIFRVTTLTIRYFIGVPPIKGNTYMNV